MVDYTKTTKPLQLTSSVFIVHTIYAKVCRVDLNYLMSFLMSRWLREE